MFGFARLMVIWFIVLSVIYFCLSLYSRASCADRLREEWKNQGGNGDEDSYVEAGLHEYDHSLRRKLILSVYIVPTVLVCVIIYLTNFA